MGSDALIVRYHRAFNDRDFEVWREIFAPDVELLVDGMSFRGVDAAIAYGIGSTTQFPGLYIGSDRLVAESGDTMVSEAELVNGDRPSGNFRRQGSVCEIWRFREGRIASCRSYYMAEAPNGEDAVRVPARGEAARVAEEQAALRRIATLVAHGVSQLELFTAVTEELGWLVAADPTSLMRVGPDDTLTLVAAWSARNAEFPIGSQQPVDDSLRALLDAARPWRWGPEDQLPPSGPFVEEARALGIRTSVAVPIVVDGRVWGVLFASSTEDRPLAEDAEARIAGFSELVATAIANAESRAELVASRARLAATADETRRRIQRDVHDGAQQRLVQAVVTLKMAKAVLDEESGPASDLVDEALQNAERAAVDLRELVRGILPASLTRGGLRAGVESLVESTGVPVSVEIPSQRLPLGLETTAYFVVAEALTNVVKHARANASHVRATIDGARLRVEVEDDGVGGADPGDGTGIVGLADRVAAAGGELTITSPAGKGTTVVAELPMPTAS
jgi:signal transduction histidine kinase/ketosteroid isomerase-like protein